MQCAKCNHENRNTAKFCEACSAAIVAQTCSSCGAELRSTASFCDECGARVGPSAVLSEQRDPRSYTPKHLADKILGARSVLEGERKTITALFADIKGSMELMEDLDPEEARRIIEPAVQLMMDAVHRYEGYVAQSTGDGIFAMFGAPIAHEDHPQRALYAALLMREKLSSYSDKLRCEGKTPVEIRVGVNTGEVVVRSIRKDDLHTEYDPIGHSTSLAARMESLAKTGTVAASGNTHKLTEGYFKFNDLGLTKVKGVSEPVRIYEVEGVGPLRTRIQVATQRGLSRFVGRHDEMEQMKRSLERAKAGHGQIVAIMGEAGVGKSRLVYEFKVVQETKYLVLESFSVSHGKAHAFLPLVELLKEYFQIRPGDDERKRREKIGGKALMLDRTLEDTLPYLFSLLGVSEQASPLLQMDAQVRRQRTLDAVKRLLVRESMNQPLIVIFEDLHWIDSETQAFLNLLAESVATTNIMLLVNYRPEYRHEWASKTYFTRLRLDPLGQEEAAELLTSLLEEDAQAALDPIRRLILDKTEGNPFFMEEVVQTLAEEGVLAGERGSYRLERPAEELSVPTTVQGVLSARIDRLGSEEKNLLQTLAIVGKEFALGLVRAVADRSDDELYRLVAHLQAAEFIYEQPAFPEPEYTFKHALTQEVAYQSVLVERRKQMHEATACAIEELYGYRLSEHYAELAHHYGRTDNTTKAVEYLHLAGQQALERSAYGEAIGQLNKALELLGQLPEDTERDHSELAVLTTLGPALIATTGWASLEMEKTYARACDLCHKVGDDTRLFFAVWGRVMMYTVRTELGKARTLCEQLLSLAENSQEPGLLVEAHRSLGTVAWYHGDDDVALGHFDFVIDSHHSDEHRELAALFLVDARVSCRMYKSLLLAHRGFLDQSLDLSREGLRLAEGLSQPLTLATALVYASAVRFVRGEYKEGQPTVDSLAAFCDEHGLTQYATIAFLQQALARIHLGQFDAAVSELEEALELLSGRFQLVLRWFFMANLAEAYGAQGEYDRSLELISETRDIASASEERGGEAYIARVQGDLLLGSSAENEAEAEGCFREAIDIARRRNRKLDQLHAAMSLARLWHKQGQKGEARKLLSEIYGWFTEGFDTPLLKEAKALLDELG